VATLESANFIKNGELLSLSQQQLVDCTLGLGNFGCDGGWAAKSFMYSDKHPLLLASDYPYTSGLSQTTGISCLD